MQTKNVNKKRIGRPFSLRMPMDQLADLQRELDRQNKSPSRLIRELTLIGSLAPWQRAYARYAKEIEIPERGNYFDRLSDLSESVSTMCSDLRNALTIIEELENARSVLKCLQPSVSGSSKTFQKMGQLTVYLDISTALLLKHEALKQKKTISDVLRHYLDIRRIASSSTSVGDLDSGTIQTYFSILDRITSNSKELRFFLKAFTDIEVRCEAKGRELYDDIRKEMAIAITTKIPAE